MPPCRNLGHIPLWNADDCHIRPDLKPEVSLTGRVWMLHLWPPISVTLRVATEDTSLNWAFVPKGMSVVLSPFAIYRMAQWSANAEEFRPERWSGREDGVATIERNYGFLSFLAGSRGFIGNVFAKVEFRCLLAVMIGRFEFE